MLAVDKDNERIADYLFRSGADPLLVNRYGKTAIDLASPSSIIYSAMKRCESYLLPLNEGYNIMLHEHICSSPVKTQKIDEYIESGADINYQNEKGFTVLMLALDNENERIAEYLLRCGADPLLKNKYGKIASDLVSRNAGIYRILKGYELLFSVIADDIPTIKTILKFDKSLIDFQGQGGYTPVLIAVEQSAFELVKYLLSQGADLSMTCFNEQGVFDLVTDNDIQKLLQLAHDSNEVQAEDSQDSLSDSRNSQHRFFNVQEVKSQPESASANIGVAPFLDDDKDDDGVVEDAQVFVNQEPLVSVDAGDVDMERVPPAPADSASVFCSSVENRQGQMPADPDADEEWEYVLVDEEEAASHKLPSQATDNSADEYSTGSEEESSAEEPEHVGANIPGSNSC
jgi:ankyrin repeat protein